MTRVRRGRLAVGGLALVLVTAGCRRGPTASASRGRPDVVTVHIRDNMFVPASRDDRPGHDRAVGERRAQHAQRHRRAPRAAASGARNLKPGKSYAHTFDGAGTFAYYCTLHGAPDERPARRARRSATPSQPTPLPSVVRRSHEPSFDRVGSHHPGARRRQDDPGGPSTAPRPGDLVLVSPGVYHESVTVATDGIVLRGVDRNRTILDGEFRRAQRRERRRRRRRRDREPHRAQLHRERVLLDRRRSATAARTSPRTATATTASTRSTRSTGSSTTRTRRAAPTPASTSASATRATRSSPMSSPSTTRSATRARTRR